MFDVNKMLQDLYRAFDFFVNIELKWTTEYLSRLISSTLMSKNINLNIGQDMQQ